jgi:hypothetical protein
VLLDAIYDEVHHRLNPGDEECWHCGGEGYTYDCIDGCCEDAESGCEDCASRCAECAIHARNIKAAVRLEVLKSLDVDVGIAWAKRECRWREMRREQVLANLHAGRAAHVAFSADERAASACWFEGLV